MKKKSQKSTLRSSIMRKNLLIRFYLNKFPKKNNKSTTYQKNLKSKSFLRKRNNSRTKLRKNYKFKMKYSKKNLKRKPIKVLHKKKSFSQET